MTHDNTRILLSDSLAAHVRERVPHLGARALSLPDFPGAAAAFFAEAIRRDSGTAAVFVVLPSPRVMDVFLADAAAFSADIATLLPYPILELAEDAQSAFVERVEALKALLVEKRRNIIVPTCVQAMLQLSPDPKRAEALSRSVCAGDDVDMTALTEWLSANGYARQPEVAERNMFAVKGGIVDVWPAGARAPVRIEFFGDTVESIRLFDAASQRSTERISEARIPPTKIARKGGSQLHAFMPAGSVVLWVDHTEIEHEAAQFEEAADIADTRKLAAVKTQLAARDDIREIFVGDPPPPKVPTAAHPFARIAGLSDIGKHFNDPDVMAAQRQKLLADSATCAKETGATAHVCVDTFGTYEHLAAELGASEFHLHVAPISGGFSVSVECEEWSVELQHKNNSTLHTPHSTLSHGVIVLSQSDLYGSSKRAQSYAIRQQIQPKRKDTATDDVAALGTQVPEHIAAGDLVVHIEHGIGRYLGMTEMEFGGVRREVLSIEYANGVKLYVPVSHAHLVSRYAGTGDAPVKPHVIGGKRWAHEKAEAASSVQMLALTMLETQARRKQQPGFAFATETPWLHEFEASFPYTETEGQAECIRKVKADMMSPHPMDRLICGDAGYGKTEVAIRAAFIAAMQGKQVAVLVPTTVLAQQHFDTFRSRMAAYPVNIAQHSRFCTRAERLAALEGAAAGTVDILIGTHGIIRPSVRFRDLGLVIIDEEQRFGVRHKEHLKNLRTMVDVITLSATPIPRTLYLGLTGARDMSLLQTPPRERLATETKVVRKHDDVIRNAILHETGRGGQVFYLHNRILTIEHVHAHLRALLPGIRIGVGHGQMPAARIEQIMRDFADGRYDVLLSTTIIESGIDIPRANTIIIDRADRFGIADLYQLRGRVGRGAIKAYAYLMIPPEGHIDTDARERLKALRQHASLGSGMHLAMRDLGIRGAGNLLGAEQSGHIAAIGFSLYCQLLRRAVARLKGEKPPLLVDVDVTFPFINLGPSAGDDASSAALPYGFIGDDAQRIDFHRRLAECASPDELADLERDTQDRFGTLPHPVRRLFTITLCRILAAERGVTRLELRDGALYMYIDQTPHRTASGNLPRPSGRTADELLAKITNLIRTLPRTDR